MLLPQNRKLITSSAERGLGSLGIGSLAERACLAERAGSALPGIPRDCRAGVSGLGPGELPSASARMRPPQSENQSLIWLHGCSCGHACACVSTQAQDNCSLASMDLRALQNEFT